MLVFNPTAPERSVAGHGVNVLGDLRGKVVGFIDNAKPNFSELADDIAIELERKYGIASTRRFRKRGPSIPAEPGVIARFAAECDLVIAGSGD